jgi:hypothetical protein
VGRQIEGSLIATGGLDGNGHATAPEAKIHERRHRELVLPQHILPNHAKLGLPVGHIDRHIRIAHQQGPGLATAAGHHQLAMVGIEEVGEIQADLPEAADGIRKQGPLGQSDGDHNGCGSRGGDRRRLPSRPLRALPHFGMENRRKSLNPDQKMGANREGKESDNLDHLAGLLPPFWGGLCDGDLN